MNTGSNVSNYNFDNCNNRTNSTSSSINTGTITTSSVNRNVYTGNTKPAPSVETMDLSFATEQVAQESKSILDKVGDFFCDLIDGAKETGAKIVNGAKSIITDGVKGLSELGSNIVSAAATLASNAGSILGNLATWGLEATKKVGATAAVIGTSVISGIANIGEGIVDGLFWCSGKLIEGGSWLVGKVAGLFSEEAEEKVMDFREEKKELVRDIISDDVIGDLNDKFYQETGLGKWINENSYLKYDSKAAQFITKGTEFVGKIAAATAATVLTGGAAAPLMLGFAFGVGEKSEEVYNNYEEITSAQEWGIFASGICEAANWYAQGKLGEGALNLINTVSKLGIKASGATALEGIKSALGQIKQDGLINTLKGIKNSTSLASLQAEDNLLDSLGIIADNYSDWLIGEEEFNKTNAINGLKELGAAWLANMFFDGAGDYLINNGKNIKLNEIFGDYIASRGTDLSATVKMISISKLDELVQDKDLYSKFLDFDSNAGTFEDFTKIELANALQDYLEGMKKTGYDFGYSKEQLDMVQSIVDKYSIDPSKFNMSELVEKYNSVFKERILYNDNPEIIFEPEFQIAANESLLEYAHQQGNHDYVRAALLMESYYNQGMSSIISRGIDVGEGRFNAVVSHILTYDNPSDSYLLYLKNYMDKGYTIGGYQQNLANQAVRILELRDYEKIVHDNIALFAGPYADQYKIDSIRGSFIYRTDPVFRANYKDGTSAMAYNDGTTSVMNLNYDTSLIKSNMTHESLHQASHGNGYYDETGAFFSQAGLKVATWNSNTGKWDSKNRGINEAATEYFSKLIHGAEYQKGTCGYEPMVDKLEEFIDSKAFTLDELKEAYFQNKPDRLIYKLDRIGSEIGIDDFGSKVMDAFDKANISNNKDDIGLEAAQALEKEGMQLLNKYLKKLKLARL